MPSQFESDFVDADYEASRKQLLSAQPGFAVQPGSSRPPSREEIESRVSEAHARLAELKRAQEQLERERAQLEEARRRRVEYQTGREEMLNHLTRGVELLKEAEFNARRDAEQMSKTLADLQQALEKVAALNEENWTQENWNTELTRALTTLENARMEWNSARLKWSVLDGATKKEVAEDKETPAAAGFITGKSFLELCKVGFALTWPIALVVLAGMIAVTVALLQR
jgi:DNA repair exonuclease SbcCD ATPase subunit